ncbi:LemA family protein [Maritalea mediterranea]|uniref:LemA family protein n=1 Tax=Maritalea mediterranea TaxID=2909667 RepID=A0ABS9E6K5_9HYPH|nr:LemA family protein [Maritalea mediterranea]MCF4097852.1 LemA family protein [Maritalea mediterranea]
MDFLQIFLAVSGVIVFFGILTYNKLVKLRQLVREGWSGIDVQLKRRADLIPNLLETVKGYVTHERETLQAVTEARAAVQSAGDASPQERGKLESMLSGALGRLFAVAEDYPDLKADSSFIEFQEALQQVEDEIQLSRRYYNGTVRNLNVTVESFPSNIVANMFNFTQEEYFELENELDRAVPDVSF